MLDSNVALRLGSGPLIATAIHDGHGLRDDLKPFLALSEAERLREEDPYTGRWAFACPTSLVFERSRFQVDLNRPRDSSVYRAPGESWGLQVWRAPLPEQLIARAHAEHDAFFTLLKRLCDEKIERVGKFVLFDLHSYNYRRQGPNEPEAPALCPDINLGTGSVPVFRPREPIERALEALRRARVGGRELDVRENVRFRGGYLAWWVHQHYPEHGLALAIEVKKFFMDEWTGVADHPLIDDLGKALADAAAAVECAL